MKSLNDNEKKTDKENCVSWLIIGIFCALFVVAINIILPFDAAFLWSAFFVTVGYMLITIW